MFAFRGTVADLMDSLPYSYTLEELPSTMQARAFSLYGSEIDAITWRFSAAGERVA